MDKVISFSSLAVLIAVGLGFGWSLRNRPTSSVPHDLDRISVDAEPPSIAPLGSPNASLRTETKTPTTQTVNPTSTATNRPNSESDLMAEIRSLKGAAPLVALRLAREGNERFPNSPDAPERTWHIVKSLTDLGQFNEAREEAKRMVETYPPSHWTMDIHRHVLSHPPEPPQ